jgi:drug/metabolite transporter (DMT)-like permease
MNDTRPLRRRVMALIVVSAVGLIMFTRTPGSDGVRWVQILLLFASGMCAGVALTLFRMSRG